MDTENPIVTQALRELKKYALMGAKKMLTTEETAEYLGVRISWLYQLVRTREIPHYKPNGRLLYFDREELDAWLRRGRIDTEGESGNVAALRDFING